jgi:hypothetical protein
MEGKKSEAYWRKAYSMPEGNLDHLFRSREELGLPPLKPVEGTIRCWIDSDGKIHRKITRKKGSK